MIRILLIFLVFLLSSLNILFGQKQELEKRINSNDVPEEAVNWIKTVEIKKKRLRWYHEMTSGKESFEAKFIHDHNLYSVEFDSLGQVEDIEVLIKKSQLNGDVLKAIDSSLKDFFDSYNLVKIQVQYSGTNKRELLNWMNGEEATVEKRYEIEFEGKNEDGWKMYEGLFSEEGSLKFYRVIIIRSTENLNY